MSGTEHSTAAWLADAIDDHVTIVTGAGIGDIATVEVVS